MYPDDDAPWPEYELRMVSPNGERVVLFKQGDGVEVRVRSILNGTLVHTWSRSQSGAALHLKQLVTFGWTEDTTHHR